MSAIPSRLSAQACSLQSLEAAEPLAGTAPQARIWVFVEQPGPWGRRALHDSQLPTGLAEVLRSLDAQPEVKVLLARHPSRPSRSESVDRFVWVSRSDGSRSELFQAHVANVNELEEIAFAGIANGSLSGQFQRITQRFGFVCTHSGHDVCCAVLGRGLIDRSLPQFTGTDSQHIWECSHIGGHRFAPTALLAPVNTVVGRCGADTLHSWVESEHIAAHTIRGASWLDQRSQAAQAYILNAYSELQPHNVGVELIDENSDEYRVIAHDGRHWRVNVISTELPHVRPESCGGDPVVGEQILVTSCDRLQ